MDRDVRLSCDPRSVDLPTNGSGHGVDLALIRARGVLRFPRGAPPREWLVKASAPFAFMLLLLAGLSVVLRNVRFLMGGKKPMVLSPGVLTRPRAGQQLCHRRARYVALE